MRWKWVIALSPALLGMIPAILVQSGRLDNLRLFLRGPLDILSVLAGLLLSGLLCAYLVVELRADKRVQQAVAQTLDQAARERRRFLRRLDHELKNPLTAIRAGLANLSDMPSNEGQKAALSSVEAQALRLSRLASDLRKLAELETRSLERSPVNIADLLQDVLAIAEERPEANQRRMTLTVPQAPWPLPTVEGDQDLLFLAVHNLVDNALKFSQPGDTLELRAFEDSSGVVIEVADTGPGVPEAEVPHLWEELYRGQGARGIPGSGLGLALVRAIIERHRGQVNLRSRAGQGTVFTVRLPVH
jgi:two-component system OmpR family sensor kinase